MGLLSDQDGGFVCSPSVLLPFSDAKPLDGIVRPAMTNDRTDSSRSAEAPIAITDVRFDDRVEQLGLEVIRSGLVAQGPMVERLEAAFADMVGVAHCVAVNNGTTALVAALKTLDLRPGDEVVTSPFTFVATLNAILEAGATARFADIRTDDFNVDPDLIESLITERTKAVMPVHLYGQTADMEAIAAIAQRHDVAIVEDAAQAHGATLSGRHAGTWGLGCFSLYATKNLTSAEGGLITTDDDKIADRLRVLRNQGMRARYQYEMVGNNYRMTDLNAALCLPQIAGYGELVARRRSNAARLIEGLQGLAGLILPSELPGRGHVWHQFTVLVDDDEGPTDRDGLASALARVDIGTGIYYPRLVFDYQCYMDDPRVIGEDVPVAARTARQCLSLPVHQYLTDPDIDRIIATVRGAWDE
jgi:dTDP-4-amino-4,6-dideoxygalactose transaminase